MFETSVSYPLINPSNVHCFTSRVGGLKRKIFLLAVGAVNVILSIVHRKYVGIFNLGILEKIGHKQLFTSNVLNR